MRLCLILLSAIVLFSCSNTKQQKDSVKYFFINGDSVRITYDGNSGYRKSMAVIRDNKENGLYKTYYVNGRTNKIGLKVNNLKQGLWLTFSTDSIVLNASHFANDTIVVELDKEDFNFVTLDSIDSNRCSLSIPAEWKVETFTNDDILLATRKSCNDGTFCPNIVLTQYKDQFPSLSFSTLVDSYSKILKENYDNVVIVYSNSLKINNEEAHQLGIMLKKNGSNLAGVITLIKGVRKIYILTEIALNERQGDFFKYKGLFEQVAATFKIKPLN